MVTDALCLMLLTLRGKSKGVTKTKATTFEKKKSGKGLQSSASFIFLACMRKAHASAENKRSACLWMTMLFVFLFRCIFSFEGILREGTLKGAHTKSCSHGFEGCAKKRYPYLLFYMFFVSYAFCVPYLLGPFLTSLYPKRRRDTKLRLRKEKRSMRSFYPSFA